jgi:hypothetical protein
VGSLIVGSLGASSGADGIAAVDVVHAVRPVGYRTLCGTPVVFVFLDLPFPVGEAGDLTVCDTCRVLAPAELSAAA